MSIYSGVTTLAQTVAVTVTIIVIPALFFSLIDLLFGWNLMENYKPVLNLALFLTVNILIPIFYIIDFVVNEFIGLINAVVKYIGLRFSYKLRLTNTIPDIQNFVANSIGLTTLGYKLSTEKETIEEQMRSRGID